MNKFAILLSLFAINGQALTLDGATDLVKQKLAGTEVASSKHYCVQGTMTCRTMYTLRDKISKAPVDIFYDTFYSADRQVGSTCYFIPNEESGFYHNYYQLSDTIFDGQLAINLLSTDEAKIAVDADTATSAFLDLNFKRLGTSRYVLGYMVQNEEKVVLTGTEYDSADPNYSAPVHTEYFRVYP